MVATAPMLEDLWPEISQIVSGKHIVIYNAQFDTKFFPDNLSCAGQISCAMLRFAPIYGQRNPRYSDFTWQKLTTAAQFIGYEWVGDAHRALADTRALWHWMDGWKAALAPEWRNSLSGRRVWQKQLFIPCPSKTCSD